MKNSILYQLAVTSMGLDLGDKFSYFFVLAPDGEILREGRVRTTPEELEQLLKSLKPARVALEVGTHSPWVSRLVSKCGHEVLVANPRDLRLIYENKNKSDQLDAEQLARIARLDPTLLHPIQHRKAETQLALASLRARDALVKARTKLVNHVRGAVKSTGKRLPVCSAASFHNKVGESLPEDLRAVLEPLLKLSGELTDQIRKYDKSLEALSEQKYPATTRLRYVTGVGPLTALAFVLVLENPSRFGNSRAVGAYLGLTPQKSQSGGHDPQMRITKAGDGFLRRLLVGSAQYILGPFGPDSDLRRYGKALAQRGGKNGKKRAVVAVARKLAVLLHVLWLSHDPYDPLRNAKRKSRRAASEVGTQAAELN